MDRYHPPDLFEKRPVRYQRLQRVQSALAVPYYNYRQRGRLNGGGNHYGILPDRSRRFQLEPLTVDADTLQPVQLFVESVGLFLLRFDIPVVKKTGTNSILWALSLSAVLSSNSESALSKPALYLSVTSAPPVAAGTGVWRPLLRRQPGQPFNSRLPQLLLKLPFARGFKGCRVQRKSREKDG